MNTKKVKNIYLRNTLCMLALPVGSWILLELICRGNTGTSLLASSADIKNLFRTMIYTFCIALALSTNVTSGRFDLSIGSQMILATILGGNIALMFNLGGIGVLILSILFGMLAGFVVGITFIKLKILPMVLGIGMTLIYECISFAVFNSQGVTFFGKPGVRILSNVGFIAIVSFIVLISVSYAFQYSPFGYDRRTIQGNQQIAHNAGINIYKNAVLCYTLAGVLVACAGVFDTAYSGGLQPVLGMSSNGSVFRNMFPLFLGIFLGVWSNPVIGTLVASFTLKLLDICLAKLGIESSIQTVIIYVLFLLFTIYRMNEHKISYARRKRERIVEAKKLDAAIAS